MTRDLPKRYNPHILADSAPAYEDLLARRRLGSTNLSVKPGQIGTSNATKPENLGKFEYAHLRAPLPKDLKGSEIFPTHKAAQGPETYFLMRRSKDGFVSATGMFKIAFPWAKTEEEKAEREYLKSREYTSQEEVAGNVWISPLFALELSKEYKMYDWVRALLDPTDIVHSPSSAKKQSTITPPPKFEIPEDEEAPSQRSRSRRSVSPSKKPSSPRKSRQARSAKDIMGTPSTAAANNSLQEALETTVSLETDEQNGIIETVEKTEVKTSGSPEKKRGRKSKKAIAEAEAQEDAEEQQEIKEEKKSDKKTEKKEKKSDKKKEAAEKETELEVTAQAETADQASTTQTTVSLDVPISLPEVPMSAAETQEMIAKAQEMVEDAIKTQATDGVPAETTATVTKKRKPTDEDDEETAAEAAQRTKKAKVLEDKLKRERVRNRALFGVSAAFALAYVIPFVLIQAVY
ncbi:hypothetical protein N7532_005359 [Penicillium argentinense]|uniref:Cell pattern formation-associated protein stuA n=1 Tax=Penicillium argentinense TaxID=1131581 RepID=A0A9W9FDR7_9EURO|nr:uncharacterized protein N7532_005359 [Penicillium argentinense]KAJ5098358.1 hypothetical protein N7532_005359 [Penicillium argentinense]